MDIESSELRVAASSGPATDGAHGRVGSCGPHGKLRWNIPGVEDALVLHSSTAEVRSTRKASASSMQSRRANAEATYVSSLFPCVGPPRRPPEVEAVGNGFP